MQFYLSFYKSGMGVCFVQKHMIFLAGKAKMMSSFDPNLFMWNHILLMVFEVLWSLCSLLHFCWWFCLFLVLLFFLGGWPVFILFFACVYWVLKNLADGFCTSSFYQADVLSIFFFLSFFVVFCFWIFKGLVCKSKMMRLTWLNLMWNSISHWSSKFSDRFTAL